MAQVQSPIFDLDRQSCHLRPFTAFCLPKFPVLLARKFHLVILLEFVSVSFLKTEALAWPISQHILLMDKILHDPKDPNYGNYGIFLITGNAGFCPSTVAVQALSWMLKVQGAGSIAVRYHEVCSLTATVAGDCGKRSSP